MLQNRFMKFGSNSKDFNAEDFLDFEQGRDLFGQILEFFLFGTPLRSAPGPIPDRGTLTKCP
jgi:hypothetical protein